ncbi:leucine-zipper of insertion element IS481, partial [Xaviernesmea oryzae]
MVARRLVVSFQEVVHSGLIEETGVTTPQFLDRRPRMNIHKNARLTPLRREEMARLVLAGMPVSQAARMFGVCAKIIRRWTERFRQGGRDAMIDRSSRPHASPRMTGQALAERIVTLRRQRL